MSYTYKMYFAGGASQSFEAASDEEAKTQAKNIGAQKLTKLNGAKREAGPTVQSFRADAGTASNFSQNSRTDDSTRHIVEVSFADGTSRRIKVGGSDESEAEQRARAFYGTKQVSSARYIKQLT